MVVFSSDLLSIQPIANDVLSQFATPSNIVIPGISKLWIPVTGMPKISSDSLYATLQVEFSPINSAARYAGNKVALAEVPKSTTKQLQVLTNDLAFNSFCWALFSDGLFQYSVQDTILALSVTLSIRATAAPVVRIVASGNANAFLVNVLVPVEVTASRKSIGLTVNCQLQAPLSIGISGQKFVGAVQGNVVVSDVKFSVTNTSIGLSLAYIEGWISNIVNRWIVPRAQSLLTSGVPFPPLSRLGFALSAPQMTSSATVVFTSTNFVPVPSSQHELATGALFLTKGK